MKVRYRAWEEWMTEQLMRLPDLDRIFHHLLIVTDGDVEDALRMMEEMNGRFGFFDDEFSPDDFRDHLLDERLIDEDVHGEASLTRRGERAIRRDALDRIFSRMKAGRPGDHRTPHAGGGGEGLSETRPWQFGDPPFDIAVNPTLENAFRRSGLDEFSLTEEDIAVHEQERLTGCATVLLLDISHSMILYGEDRITPAKEVALALLELIRTRYPKDSLHVAVFGDDAAEIPLDQLPYVSVGPYHTNTKAALQLAQRILATRKQPNKQIFMVTDGKPSVIRENGRLYKNSFGLDTKIVNKTLDEAGICRRRGILISTFMVAQDYHLVNFVERLTEINRGRAYYTGLDDLGRFLFVDYVRNRKRRTH
ncbi:VWA domain-containing protein [bacterium]|nr:VWA domain-containing protein [bacterium]